LSKVYWLSSSALENRYILTNFPLTLHPNCVWCWTIPNHKLKKLII